jgi:ribitol-5-phosphate 2-dehydrogenase (NADP+) / D-ribitol-5-phosphate cytidylyltransferase
MNIAVILAGGKGERLGESVPKQFIKIAGKKIIEHTIDVFEKNKNIDEICVVINPQYKLYFEEIVLENKWLKVKKVLQGGSERYFSSLAAINAYNHLENCNLIFHDAVRPLVSNKIINDVVSALNKGYNAVDVAIPTSDTIIEVNEDDCISKIPYRKFLKRGQTPQAFNIKTIEKAYELFLSSNKESFITDDCGVVLQNLPHENIYVVDGEESNMKLTYPEDYYL